MKKKVVEYAERWTSGGIESYILNLIKYLDKEKFEIHIVVAQKETEIYDTELLEYGIKVESILPQVYNKPIKRMLCNQKAFRNYFRRCSCDVLHLHICQGVALRYAKLARQMGVGRIISHCHNAEMGDGHYEIKMIGHCLGKELYCKYIDQMLSCSDLAAKWLYRSVDLKQDKVIISKYIVEIDKFIFSDIDRKEMRKRYLLSEDITIYLNIGRLHYQKNQKFLLNVYKEIQKIDKNSILIMIGTGELKEEIHEYAKQIGIYNKIIFINMTREISKYMSMSDAFLLPSLFEGNPVVGTEAQASGLICFFSDTITRQAKILESTTFISLDRTANSWAQQIISNMRKYNKVSRDTYRIMKQNGYDVKKQILDIENIYLD